MTTQPLRVKSAELTISGASPEHSSVRTVLFSLAHGDGSIFGLIDVTVRDEALREKLVHLVASHLEVMRSDIERDRGNIPRRFEAVLVTLNNDLARVAEGKNIPLKKINIVVGVTTNSQVFFSGIGTSHALFLHRTAERRYVVYELDAQLTQQETTWEKPLVTVLDGELHAGDVFYVATRLPPHALSMGDIQDILVTLPPSGALERIQQSVPVPSQYGGICFQVTDDAPAGPPKKANPMASLSDFEDTKARTADLLGDQAPDVPQKLALAAGNAKKMLASYSDNPVWRGAKRLARYLLSLIESVMSTRKERTTLPTRHANNGHRLNNIAGTLSALRHAGVTAAQGASRTTKVVAASVVILVVIVGISIGASRAQQRAAEANAAYQSLVAKIEEKRTAAEAAIIYGNTQEAQTLVADAQSLVATLPHNSAAEQTKADDLNRALSDLLGKTRGLETVTPTVIATLPATTAFPLVGLTSAGNAVFGVGADAAPLRVNEVSKSLERADVGTSPAQNILRVCSEANDILTVDMDKRLWRTTTATPSVTSLSSGTDSMASVDDIVSYNGNIYVLTTVGSQVVKMRPQGLGFEAGTSWITARTSDLSGAKALAIDGSVWILTANDVIEFTSGRETPWAHATIDPVLAKPIDIWTDIDSSFLYILDGSDGRVVVMNKATGNIVAQYVANLTGVVGFAVREGENRIILSTATTVYSYTATHLLK